MAPMLDDIQKEIYQRFGNSSWLSDQEHCKKFFEWNTFFRRNLPLFATTYLGISLHLYQFILLYLMSSTPFFCLIAARATAKSFLIAVYICCKAILYPGIKIVISAGNKAQASLIVTEKIRSELMSMSGNLNREISKITKIEGDELVVYFKNGSKISSILASDRARGHRSNLNIYEEFRQIDKKVLDNTLAPFLIMRQPSFITDPAYSGIKSLYEDPQEVFISSSWRKSHWIWDIIKSAASTMLNGGPACLMAADYSVTLKYGIRSRKQLEREYKKLDPMSWMIEYRNLMPSDSVSAYFPYSLLTGRQLLRRAFYPRRQNENAKAKLIAPVERQEGEIRIVSCDIAMMDGAVNDNSCFVCLRMLPEDINTDDDVSANKFGYRIQVPYIETRHGEETIKQAIRIKQLAYDWDADYIVLDAKNFGISVYDAGARILYDEERGVEYKPWMCMNNPEIAKRINTRVDNPNVYCVNASSRFNSDAAVTLRQMLADNKIDFLVNPNDAYEFMMAHINGYVSLDAENQIFFDSPYLETTLMINETSGLEYEQLENGLIRIRESGRSRKDRYSALSYGCYFASEIERDVCFEDKFDLSAMSGFVSSISF